MSAPAPIAIAEALAEQVNSVTFSQSVRAYRSYDPSTELEDLKTARLDVIAPANWTKELSSRSQTQQTCDIRVFVRKQLVRTDGDSLQTGDIDQWLAFLDELTDAAWDGTLSDYSATLQNVQIDTPFDADALKQNSLFISVVTFTFTWYATFNA